LLPILKYTKAETKTSMLKYNNETPQQANPSQVNTQSDSITPTTNAPSYHDIELPSDSLLSQSLTVLGQYKNSFILASDNDGLIIIDQHVAHERILYNEYLHLLENNNISIQYLLIPLPIDVTPTQKIIINDHKTHLEKLGFILEPFSRNTFLLKAIPAFIKNTELSEMLQKIIDDFQNILTKNEQSELINSLAASIACHAAIKINTPLSKENMQYIVDQLMKTNLPQKCPHGRPIIMKITDYQIYKAFKRQPPQ